MWSTMVALLLLLLLLAAWDRLQTAEPVFRVYPIIGRLVALLRRARAAVHGATTLDGPFTPSEIGDIRRRAKTGVNVASFGTRFPQNSHVAPHNTVDVAILPTTPRIDGVQVGGGIGSALLHVPRLNFGALGFGPVSENVIRALGIAAAEVDCILNTGEDGLTQLHAESSARLLWQLGTGYWGCRDKDGNFNPSAFAETASSNNVAMIEVKLSQAAKPGAGGFLPATKNTRRVARMLGVSPNTDVTSPRAHPAFSSIPQLLDFLLELSRLSQSRPVGIKLCVGSRESFRRLAEAMAERSCVPDFITIDGAEGGSGAAPSALLNRCGLPVRLAVKLVHDTLAELSLRGRTRIFAAGAVKNGYDVFELIALGADACFFTRAPMVAMGCVQALECHSGACPSGIASHSPWRRSAIHSHTQGMQLARYYRTVQDDLAHLMAASGCSTIGDIRRVQLL